MPEVLIVENDIAISLPGEQSTFERLVALSDGRYATFWVAFRYDRLLDNYVPVGAHLRVFSGIWGDEGSTYDLDLPDRALPLLAVELTNGNLGLVFQHLGHTTLQQVSLTGEISVSVELFNDYEDTYRHSAVAATGLKDGNILIVVKEDVQWAPGGFSARSSTRMARSWHRTFHCGPGTSGRSGPRFRSKNWTMAGS